MERQQQLKVCESKNTSETKQAKKKLWSPMSEGGEHWFK
jgi:hypothetical protein